MEDSINNDKPDSSKPNLTERLVLYKEYRLIERNEAEISGSWKGTHLLFFFLAFVFGSFCTFCFHVLMYLFDEKCVLFPKLLLLKELRHSVLYDYMPNPGLIESLPVDFVTTHWMDKSTCYLPTYVPLVSGIFGLVWTTMFLMFSSGSRTLGLQRSWRLLPPVIIFSVAMGSLCIYTSSVTTEGLLDLCAKLSEITGSTTCSYTINVVTLAFERRVRGVFQAIQLTIISAWLHTSCWVLAAIVALVRVVLVIDFRLVCVSADLCGNIEKMLERHEKHIRTVSPEQVTKDNCTNTRMHANLSSESIKVRFKNKGFTRESDHTFHYFLSPSPVSLSRPSLVPEEKRKLIMSEICSRYPKKYLFVIKFLYDILDSSLPRSSDDEGPLSLMSKDSIESNSTIVRQHGKQCLHDEEAGINIDDLGSIKLSDSVQDTISDLSEVYTRTLTDLSDSEQALQKQPNTAVQISSNLKDAKLEDVFEQSETAQTRKVTPKIKPDENVHSTETLKPEPDDVQDEFGVGIPTTQLEEEVLTLIKDLSMPSSTLTLTPTSTALSVHDGPKEVRTSTFQDPRALVATAQNEVALKLIAYFESLSVALKSRIQSIVAGASSSQDKQPAAPAPGEQYSILPITTNSQPSTPVPKSERAPQPTRGPRDQESDDIIMTDDNDSPALDKDEGVQTRKKEKQD